MRSQTGANIFICLLDGAYVTPLANIKMDCQRWPRKPLILGRSGTQYVAMVTKLLSSYCGAPLVGSYCKESNISDTNWLRYLCHHIWSKLDWVYDVITLFCIFWKLEYLRNEKRYLKIVNSVFLLVQATFLCLKMADIGKMRFSTLFHFKINSAEFIAQVLVGPSKQLKQII